MANLPPIPNASTPVLNPDGTMNRQWYTFLNALAIYINSLP